MDSVLQKKKCCYLCDTVLNLESHHIFFGPFRNKAEKYGYKVWLCPDHHRGKFSPHQNRRLDLNLKQIAQERYEETNTRESFIKEFGRNYLE